MGLIDKDRLITELQKAYAEPICSIEEAIDIALTTINEQPPVDAEPIQHGHWEWNDYGGFGNYHCSVCKYIPYGKFSRKFHSEMFAQVLYPNYMYCSRCGAKMDEEVNEDETS